MANQPILSKHVRTLQLQPEEHNRRPTDVEIREALFLTNAHISISSQCDFKRIIRLLMALEPVSCSHMHPLHAPGSFQFFYIETEYFHDNTAASNLLEGNALETFP